jgi:hypothetical protein
MVGRNEWEANATGITKIYAAQNSFYRILN